MAPALQPYREFRPTPFDPAGAFLQDQETWGVAPVAQTRDSGPLDRSNFAALVARLEDADPDGDNYETHSFNHWGPGWFEIIVVRPDTPAYAVAVQAKADLEDYPVLNDDDYSEREWAEVCEAWEALTLSERLAVCRQHPVSIFAARHPEVPEGLNHYEDFYEAR